MEGLSSTCHSPSILLALWRRASCPYHCLSQLTDMEPIYPHLSWPHFPPTSSFEALSKFQTPTILSGSYSTHSHRQQGDPDVQ